MCHFLLTKSAETASDLCSRVVFKHKYTAVHRKQLKKKKNVHPPGPITHRALGRRFPSFGLQGCECVVSTIIRPGLRRGVKHAASVPAGPRKSPLMVVHGALPPLSSPSLPPREGAHHEKKKRWRGAHKPITTTNKSGFPSKADIPSRLYQRRHGRCDDT